MNMSQILSSPQTIPAVLNPESSILTINSQNVNTSTIQLPPLKDISTSEKCTSMLSVNKLPQFLEPIPVFENYRCESAFVPRIYSSFSSKETPSLVPSSASSCSESPNPPSPLPDVNSSISHQQRTSPISSINSSQIPCRYAYLPSIQPKPNTIPHHEQLVSSRCPVAHNSNWSRESSSIPMVDESGAPLSPTMRAAAAAAAAASMQNHSGSLVADTFINSISLSAADEEEFSAKKQRLNHGHITSSYTGGVCPFSKEIANGNKQPSFARVSFMLHGTKRPSTIGADQRMFLTKNAHIKRPRNAWIHFRCHYGQALKSQDPTLRAEEISKRASRRWARLSENEKKPWHDLAEQDKQAHKAAFPEYRYCPRRSNTAAMLAAKDAAVVQQQQQKPETNSMYKPISSHI
ncbi:uncharacterized protein BX663DRAFT_482191 [Cokeromyces recurvatus]|uniref:uncharacterized protein n=1 Tax=Cokeromyces recurvatus TaxID=90255 RepID=UPI0022211926|nr:uncharacterized protein BX663DRAFT_482191 [Cokeromyces recurvatus]KAI7907945.1 hypothetical protein BX663DRAFT_482191 [Cokeromyces recurvatus]